jgi:hypothetical protein
MKFKTNLLSIIPQAFPLAFVAWLFVMIPFQKNGQPPYVFSERLFIGFLLFNLLFFAGCLHKINKHFIRLELRRNQILYRKGFFTKIEILLDDVEALWTEEIYNNRFYKQRACLRAGVNTITLPASGDFPDIYGPCEITFQKVLDALQSRRPFRKSSAPDSKGDLEGEGSANILEYYS